MKVIDILNKIANGEEVPDFRYGDDVFRQVGTRLHNDTDGKWVDVKIGNDDFFDFGYTGLNEEVEILEEDKKIEKINYIGYGEDGNLQYKIINKLNEIIDYLNKENK